MHAPLARILIRYVIGALIGADMAGALAADSDVVLVLATLLGLGNEALWLLARRRGWAT